MTTTKPGHHVPKANIKHEVFTTEDLNLLYFIEKNLEDNKNLMNKKLLTIDGDALQQIFPMITKLSKKGDDQ